MIIMRNKKQKNLSKCKWNRKYGNIGYIDCFVGLSAMVDVIAFELVYMSYIC